MDGKNPISFLQEFMIKKKCIPKYDTILEKNGTHLNHFIIEVKCDTYSARGEGTNKKEAKTNAALKMLKLINIGDNNLVVNQTKCSSVDLPTTSTASTINYVGKLQEMAAANEYVFPNFSSGTMTGPSHCPKFTITCTYLDKTVVGTGSTKKEAKNQAAQKMYESTENLKKYETISCPKIESYLESITHDITDLKLINEKKIAESSSKAIEKFLEIKKKAGAVPLKTEESTKEYHNFLKKKFSQDEINIISDKLHDVIESCKEFSPLSKIKLIEILNSLKINYKENNYYDINKNGAIYGFQLQTVPVICEMGHGINRQEAEFSAIAEIAKTFLLMIV